MYCKLGSSLQEKHGLHRHQNPVSWPLVPCVRKSTKKPQRTHEAHSGPETALNALWKLLGETNEWCCSRLYEERFSCSEGTEVTVGGRKSQKIGKSIFTFGMDCICISPWRILSCPRARIPCSDDGEWGRHRQRPSCPDGRGGTCALLHRAGTGAAGEGGDGRSETSWGQDT